MSKWAFDRDEFGWNIGFYPTHDRDWQLSLCHVGRWATFLDIGKGESGHDWRVRWETRHFRPLFSEREGHQQWHTLGRFGVRNHA